MYSRIVSSTLQSSTTREAWSVTARGNTSACCREGAPQIVSQTRLAPRLKSFRANDAPVEAPQDLDRVTIPDDGAQ